MQIIVEVNDDQFKEIVDKSDIIGLPKEELQEILLDGIREYLKQSDVVKELLTTKSSSYYSDREPTQFLKTLLKDAMPTDILNDIRDEMLKNLRDSYDKILRNAIADILMRGIVGNSSFDEAVFNIIRDAQNN